MIMREEMVCLDDLPDDVMIRIFTEMHTPVHWPWAYTIRVSKAWKRIHESKQQRYFWM